MRQITVGGGSVRTALAVVAVVAGDVIVVVVVDVTLLSSTRVPRIIGAYICAFLFVHFFISIAPTSLLSNGRNDGVVVVIQT